jgi:ribonuclease HI
LNLKKLVIHTDGAARGNPGPAAIGVTIKDENGNPVATISRCIGRTTNNQAEYRAIITSLETAISIGGTQVSLYTDSELAVRQINGRYRVKSQTLKPLHHRVKELAQKIECFTATHVVREQNKEADSLANRALGK